MLFYVKRTPLVDDSRRVIVGVGKVNHVAKSLEYRYEMSEQEAPLRALLWERLIQHSIRPDDHGGFTDGFLLPYHQAMTYADLNSDFNPACVVAFAPDDTVQGHDIRWETIDLAQPWEDIENRLLEIPATYFWPNKTAFSDSLGCRCTFDQLSIRGAL